MSEENNNTANQIYEEKTITRPSESKPSYSASVSREQATDKTDDFADTKNKVLGTLIIIVSKIHDTAVSIPDKVFPSQAFLDSHEVKFCLGAGILVFVFATTSWKLWSFLLILATLYMVVRILKKRIDYKVLYSMVPVSLAVLLVFFTFSCSNSLPNEKEVIKLMESAAKKHFLSQVDLSDDINFVMLSTLGVDVFNFFKAEVTELSHIEKVDRRTYRATTPISFKTYDPAGDLDEDTGELALVEWIIKYSGKYITVKIEDTIELK